MAANAVVFVVSLLLSRADVVSLDARSVFSALGPSDDVVLFLGVLLPDAVLRDLEVWRLVTSAFLHAGIVHLVFNLLALNSLGPLLESTLGWRRFAMVYMGSALAGGAAEVLVSEGALGASGAIFGLLGAGLAIGFRGGADVDRARAFRSHFGRWAVYGLVFTFAVPNISIAGHLGGLAGGIVLGLALSPGPMLAGAPRAESTWTGVIATALLVLVPASFAAAIVTGLVAPSDASAPFTMSRWPVRYVASMRFRTLDLGRVGAPGFLIDVPDEWTDIPGSNPETIALEGRTVMNVVVYSWPAGDLSPREYLDAMSEEWGRLVPGTGTGSDVAAEGDFRNEDGGYASLIRVVKVEGGRFVVVTSAAHPNVGDVCRRSLFARVADSLRRRP